MHSDTKIYKAIAPIELSTAVNFIGSSLQELTTRLLKENHLYGLELRCISPASLDSERDPITVVINEEKVSHDPDYAELKKAIVADFNRALREIMRASAIQRYRIEIQASMLGETRIGLSIADDPMYYFITPPQALSNAYDRMSSKLVERRKAT